MGENAEQSSSDAVGCFSFMAEKLTKTTSQVPPAGYDSQDSQEYQRPHHHPGGLVGVVVVNAVIGSAAAVLAVEGHKDGAEHIESRQKDSDNSQPEQHRLAGERIDQN